VTRLLDRLVARGLVTRDRRADDRRVVISKITGDGLAVLADLDAPLEELHRDQTAHMDEAELRHLVHLLERLRAP
jgi:DNA-binding MarR family transcriptional regulator